MNLSILLESHLGSQSSSRVRACTCDFLTSCSSSVTLAAMRFKGSVALHRGFPTRLSNRAVPHVLSIVGTKVTAFLKGKPCGLSPLHTQHSPLVAGPLPQPHPSLFPLTTSKLWGPGSDPTIPPRMGPPECPLSVLHDDTGCAQTEPGGRLNILRPSPRICPLKLCLLLPILIDEISPIL